MAYSVRTPAGVAELHRAAGLLAAEDRHQSLGDAVVSDDILDVGLLAELSLVVFVGPTGLLGEGFGMLDQAVGCRLQQGEEVLAADLQHAVHKRVEVGVVPEGEGCL